MQLRSRIAYFVTYIFGRCAYIILFYNYPQILFGRLSGPGELKISFSLACFPVWNYRCSFMYAGLAVHQQTEVIRHDRSAVKLRKKYFSDCCIFGHLLGYRKLFHTHKMFYFSGITSFILSVFFPLQFMSIAHFCVRWITIVLVTQFFLILKAFSKKKKTKQGNNKALLT